MTQGLILASISWLLILILQVTSGSQILSYQTQEKLKAMERLQRVPLSNLDPMALCMLACGKIAKHFSLASFCWVCVITVFNHCYKSQLGNVFVFLVSNVGERPWGLLQSPDKRKPEKMRGSLSRKGDKIKFVDVRFKTWQILGVRESSGPWDTFL